MEFRNNFNELTQLKHPFIGDNIRIDKRMNNIKEGKYSDFVNKNYSERLLNLIKNILRVFKWKNQYWWN